MLRGPGSLVLDGRAELGDLLGADFFGTWEQPRGQTGYWRPLILLGFRAEAWLSGGSETGHAWLAHVVTILCHALASLALWALLRGLGLGGAPALLAAVAFACHPAHVESVAWSSGRVESLPTALAWAGTALMLRGRSGSPAPRAEPGAPRALGLAAGLGAGLLFGLAPLAKESAVLLVLLAVPLARLRGLGWRASLAPPLLGLAAAVGLRATLFGLVTEIDPQAYTGPAESGTRWLTWLAVIPDLVRLTVWPGPPTPVHPFAPVTSLGPDVIAGGLVLLLGLGACALAWRRASAPGLLIAGLLAGTLLMLAPWVRIPMGFEEVAGPLYERYVYALSCAPCVLLGIALAPWARRWRHGPWLASLALLAVLGPLTTWRCGPWSDDAAFARAALERAPGSASFRNHLGVARLEAYRATGDPQAGLEALGAFESALALSPGDKLAQLNRFLSLAMLGRQDEAQQRAEELERHHGDDPQVLANLAEWQLGLGRWREAARLLEAELATGRARPGVAAMLERLRDELAPGAGG